MTLQEAIDTVQRIYDQANAAAPSSDGRLDHEAWGRRMDAGENAVKRLVSEHGAKFRGQGWDGYRLRLAGVSTSCTSGHWGLITNWLTAARKKLKQEN